MISLFSSAMTKYAMLITCTFISLLFSVILDIIPYLLQSKRKIFPHLTSGEAPHLGFEYRVGLWGRAGSCCSSGSGPRTSTNPGLGPEPQLLPVPCCLCPASSYPSVTFAPSSVPSACHLHPPLPCHLPLFWLQQSWARAAATTTIATGLDWAFGQSLPE